MRYMCHLYARRTYDPGLVCLCVTPNKSIKTCARCYYVAITLCSADKYYYLNDPPYNTLTYNNKLFQIVRPDTCVCDKSIDIPIHIATYNNLDKLFQNYQTNRLLYQRYGYFADNNTSDHIGNRNSYLICKSCGESFPLIAYGNKLFCRCHNIDIKTIHDYMPALAYRMAQTRALIMTQSEQMYKEQLNYVIRQGTRRIEQLTAAHRKQIRHIKRGAVQSSPLAESEAVVVEHGEASDTGSNSDSESSYTDDSESDAPQWQSEY